MASAANNAVINWEGALQQCGDDEEFLHELLGDFRSELETQLSTIASIIQNPQDSPYHRISRAAHGVKGAAANLMCDQLRVAAFQLEQSAKKAHEAGETMAPQELQSVVQTRHAELQQAAQNYMVFIKSIGL